ncbi:MAG TPA: aminoacetone oxidase family FAD-binding enzyme [Thauera sp.]|nr:aminoacetone oxidase family FAD-binding enzyme [Thauera sp.]HHW65934.1 TIGR03862 family flavoprotein [Rhodocyclaceae bacterium]
MTDSDPPRNPGPAQAAASAGSDRTPFVCVVGGGPAGLMAAEILSSAGLRVTVFDAMPSVGRKFLLAGRGGLNLTHSEARESFLGRYGTRRAQLEPMIEAFGPDALRDWARTLGVETFVGSSGRVFPVEMKAAPLLRAWLARLRAAGVRFEMRHRWRGWAPAGGATGSTQAQTADTSTQLDAAQRPRVQQLLFDSPEGRRVVQADAVVLALGGGSWAKLGSDGAWVPALRAAGAEVAELLPANCGFDIARPAAGGSGGELVPGWTPHFAERFRGQPLKSVSARVTTADGAVHERAGECLISETGIEGGLIYALSAPLRDTLIAQGAVTLHLDLAPGRSIERLAAELRRPRGSRSMSSHLHSQAGIKGVKAGLLRECLVKADFDDPERLAAAIKGLPLTIVATRPLDEAISSAGGVRFEALDRRLMLRARPGVFVAGEMLDWEAPTGGYLLTACFASGLAAGRGALHWLSARSLTPAAAGTASP